MSCVAACRDHFRPSYAEHEPELTRLPGFVLQMRYVDAWVASAQFGPGTYANGERMANAGGAVVAVLGQKNHGRSLQLDKNALISRLIAIMYMHIPELDFAHLEGWI